MPPLVLPKPPKEVRVQSSLDGLAPLFKAAVDATVRDVVLMGFDVRVFETLRTEERQRFLHGFGRLYDDGRGIVTNSKTAGTTWHGFGLAADLVEDDATPWKARNAFWQAIGLCAERHGLVWGGRWKFVDLPHVQWGKCPRSPNQAIRDVQAARGNAAVWDIVGAG